MGRLLKKLRRGSSKRASAAPETRLPSRRMLLAFTALGILATAMICGSAAWARLSEHVDAIVLADRPGGSLQFVDLPEPLLTLAAGELQASLADLRNRPWTDPNLCEEMGKRLSTSHWIASLQSVRRTGDGRFEIRATYRVPVATIVIASDYYLIDAEGFRLPGVYTDRFTGKVLRGIAAPPPPPATRWPGDDVQAGLKLLRLVSSEAYSTQIAGVYLDNFEGRRDPRESHLELMTERSGGRIRWGSAPGRELEENSITQKVQLLRKNFAATGRADANHLVIDISTFPDRYTVPTELGLCPKIAPDALKPLFLRRNITLPQPNSC